MYNNNYTNNNKNNKNKKNNKYKQPTVKKPVLTKQSRKLEIEPEDFMENFNNIIHPLQSQDIINNQEEQPINCSLNNSISSQNELDISTNTENNGNINISIDENAHILNNSININNDDDDNKLTPLFDIQTPFKNNILCNMTETFFDNDFSDNNIKQPFDFYIPAPILPCCISNNIPFVKKFNDNCIIDEETKEYFENELLALSDFNILKLNALEPNVILSPPLSPTLSVSSNTNYYNTIDDTIDDASNYYNTIDDTNNVNKNTVEYEQSHHISILENTLNDENKLQHNNLPEQVANSILCINSSFEISNDLDNYDNLTESTTSTSSISSTSTPTIKINTLSNITVSKINQSITKTKKFTTAYSQYILDPFTTILKLNIIADCPIGTKLAITKNTLQIQHSGLFQGLTRYLNKHSKCDLRLLLNPIQIACDLYLKEILNKSLYHALFIKAISGLKMLQKTYNYNSSIFQLLEKYIYIINFHLIETNSDFPIGKDIMTKYYNNTKLINELFLFWKTNFRLLFVNSLHINSLLLNDYDLNICQIIKNNTSVSVSVSV